MEKGRVIGTYDTEFDYAAEEDPIILAVTKFMSTIIVNSIPGTTIPIEQYHLLITATLQKVLFGNGDNGSVSTLDTYATRKHVYLPNFPSPRLLVLHDHYHD